MRTSRPTIVGASDGERTVSVPHEEGKHYLIETLYRNPQAIIVGHNFLSADYGVAVAEGIRIDPKQIMDTIHYHWLTNMSLCKGTKKSDDEEGERRGRGFMNLWTMCSQYTDAPNWKDCWGESCESLGNPCPRHNPFEYNGNDCYWPALAAPKILQRAILMGVDKLIPLHRDVALVLAKMNERGVLVDVPYIGKLRDEFVTECEKLEKTFSFNPNSPKQVMERFKLPNAQEETIREACEDDPDNEELARLLEYKELGNGPDRWFAPRRFDYDKNRWEGYVDPDGFIHCNLQFFTSTGRLACSNPNLQNVAKRRKDRVTGESLGKKIRRAIIAPDGYYLYRADLKNAENRVFLHLAGHTEIPNIDFHAYMRDMIGIKEDDPFARILGNAREAAKSVTHATDYLEGLQLVEPAELRRPKIVNEIAAGARIVFNDWIVFGKVVTFTGINLANRAFGSATYENRKRALDVQVKYFNGFPLLRELQKKITKQVERERCVRPPTGYVLASYGYEQDRLKTAAAMWGSNPVAHITKYAMVNAENHPRLIPTLQIHDELTYVVDSCYDPREVKKWIRECMEIEIPEIPGMKIPVDVTRGLNWADQETIDG